ncbi:PREDICTED: uncharacterized protein LOC104821400 [Tarenaya hassleriana]|uniref:uncharacterized protein LOC104821400 n=1 Tax=Tarenaya hassleriana TaxID=28532 RepID=UPI00053C6836|nr:PREDICTED: uncharacterized protein LOC104821400 [Tarenaya hassleriana]
MAVWSAENATKAYLSTLKMDQRTKEPNVAEFISAFAAGNNSRRIVVACAGAANPDMLVALKAAAFQTGGQVVCILRGVEELIISKKILGSSEAHQIEFVLGNSWDMLSDHFREADFILVDCNLENHEEIVREIAKEERTRSKGGVIVGYNAFSKGSWRFSDGKRTQFLPIGEGLLVTRIGDKINQAACGKEKMNIINGGHRHHHNHVRKSHWVVKVDKCTGEEHVFRVRVPQGEIIEA